MHPADTEDFWEDLLACIEEHRVIPIVGPELVRTMSEGISVPLNHVLADRLAEGLRLKFDDGPATRTLNEVVTRHLKAGGRKEDVYPRLRAIMRELSIEPSPGLLKLAGIGGFDLFVSLTVDTLLVDAVNKVRFEGNAKTDYVTYTPNKLHDLPAEREKLARPLVYGLFGRVTASPEYVVTDEDMLDFLHSLQSETRRPPLLFDELQNNHLLIIGCGFSDWLARFFVRIARNKSLSMQRAESEILVDTRTSGDGSLVTFLEHFSYGTRVLPLAAEAFVDELERRWAERHPLAGAVHPAPAAAGKASEMRPGSIFVSYASEDVAAADGVRRALEGLGLDVWFDKERLEAGDAYDQKIRRNIRNCSLFLPIISANAERRIEGYFRLEWRLADERSRTIAPNVPFVVPVVIDDTANYLDSVPESFSTAQWTRLPDGIVSEEFGARMKELIREFRRRERGAA